MPSSMNEIIKESPHSLPMDTMNGNVKGGEYERRGDYGV